MKSITVQDFNTICRICLGNEHLEPIIGAIIDGLRLVDLLQEVVNTTVDKDDLLPQNICTNCLSVIHKLHEFKKQCLDNETVMQLLLQKSEGCEVAGETEDENEIEITITIEKNNDINYYEQEKSEEQIYKCGDCDFSSANQSSLHKHKREAHQCNFTCEFCGKTFTRSKLQRHLLCHTKEKPFQCEVCNQRFSMSSNLKRHQMIHTGERPHVCNICDKGFIQAKSLQAHEKTHQLSKALGVEPPTGRHFSCSMCGRGFLRLGSYHAHVMKHTQSESVEKKTVESESLDYVCDICGRAFKSNHLLKAHKVRHGGKSFLCSVCGKGFVTQAALTSHFKIHSGERPHTCLECNKSFAHVSSFESHMLIHAGLKPYSCTLCSKSFTQMSHLRYHSRVHSGERPYACSYCGKSFALKGNLTVHVRMHTGETPYVCPVCGKGFHDSSSMKKHKKSHKTLLCERQDEFKGDCIKDQPAFDYDVAVDNRIRVVYDSKGD